MTYDITEKRAAQDKLAFLAHHDGLTGLPNRAAFTERLTLALSRLRRSGKPLAAMYLDIDKFKSINDTYGHGVGDELLKAFAQRLRNCVRDTDLVGRLGGDEFVILLEDLAQAADAGAVADKIVEAMRLPFVLSNCAVRATTSVGVAVCMPQAEDADGAALLERADAALYLAKRAGRDTYCTAPPAPPSVVREGASAGEVVNRSN